MTAASLGERPAGPRPINLELPRASH